MGHYRARDLLLFPNIVSLVRVPLALLFPIAVDRPILAFAVLAAAGLSDIVDGWWARHHGQVTAIGAVLDGVTDKIFVTSVAMSLLFAGRINVWELFLLSCREIGEAPLVVWWVISHHRRRRKSEEPRANVLGKLATTLQFVTVVVLTAGRSSPVLLYVTAAAGALAAISYWRREL